MSTRLFWGGWNPPFSLPLPLISCIYCEQYWSLLAHFSLLSLYTFVSSSLYSYPPFSLLLSVVHCIVCHNPCRFPVSAPIPSIPVCLSLHLTMFMIAIISLPSPTPTAESISPVVKSHVSQRERQRIWRLCRLLRCVCALRVYVCASNLCDFSSRSANTLAGLATAGPCISPHLILWSRKSFSWACHCSTWQTAQPCFPAGLEHAHPCDRAFWMTPGQRWIHALMHISNRYMSYVYVQLFFPPRLAGGSLFCRVHVEGIRPRVIISVWWWSFW